MSAQCVVTPATPVSAASACASRSSASTERTRMPAAAARDVEHAPAGRDERRPALDPCGRLVDMSVHHAGRFYIHSQRLYDPEILELPGVGRVEVFRERMIAPGERRPVAV